MKYANLGNGPQDVSRVIFGTWQFGGDWGNFPEEDAIDVIHAARDSGVNFFDTAQAYGYGISETVLGKALKKDIARDRSSVILSTKGGLRPGDPSSRGRDGSALWMRACLEQSLELLGVDFIDVYHVHWPDHKVEMAETAEFMRSAIDEGLISCAGVSNFTLDEIKEFANYCPVTSIQPPFHMFRRDIEHDILPYAAQNGIGVMTYSPLASGLLSGRMTPQTKFDESDWRVTSSAFHGEGFLRNLEVIEDLRAVAAEKAVSVSQLAIAWTLAQSGITGVVIGARSSKNAQSSGAAADIELDAETLERIEVIIAQSKPVGGISPEGID